jgi:hypothetical protein
MTNDISCCLSNPSHLYLTKANHAQISGLSIWLRLFSDKIHKKILLQIICCPWIVLQMAMKGVAIVVLALLFVGSVFASSHDCWQCDPAKQQEICSVETCCEVCESLCYGYGRCAELGQAMGRGSGSKPGKTKALTTCSIDCAKDVPQRFAPECKGKKQRLVYLNVGEVARSKICNQQSKNCECYKFYAEDYTRESHMAFKSSPDHVQKEVIQLCNQECSS